MRSGTGVDSEDRPGRAESNQPGNKGDHPDDVRGNRQCSRNNVKETQSQQRNPNDQTDGTFRSPNVFWHFLISFLHRSGANYAVT